MAKSNQTFKAALKLNAAQFKKEAASVQRIMGGLKSSFMSFAGALGAGLGFAQLMGSVKRTVVELSTARATLENVSKETKIYSDGVHTAAIETSNYAENLQYLDRLAKDYKQDIITLTDSFAKFSAAASSAGVAMSTQRDVFESLTRAATFFHMSGERTQMMMVAIEQMFSKGKVTSEELRRQLGNNLPGAFGLMAQAMGVTNAELDKMLKNGEVAADVALPKFAKELDKITKNLNLNSIQLAQNELRNAWVGFLDSKPFESFYKAILRLTTRFLNALKTGFWTISGLIAGAFGGNFLSKTFDKGLAQWDKYVKGVQGNINKLEKQLGVLTGKFSNKYGIPVLPQRLAKQIYADEGKSLPKTYNKDYIAIKQKQKEIADAQAIINSKTTKWGKAVAGVQKGYSAVGGLAKSLLTSLGFTAAIAAIGALIGGIIDLVKRLIEARNAVKNLEKDFAKLSDSGVQTPVEIEVRNWVKDLEKLSSKGLQGSKEWATYIGEINKLMGAIGDGELKVADNIDIIKKKVGEWLDLSRKVRQYNFAVDEESRAESNLFDLEERKKKIVLQGKYAPAGALRYANNLRVKLIDKEIEAEKAKIKRAQKLQEDYKLSAKEQAKKNGDTGGTESDLSKLIKKQKQALKELDNQYKAGAYTEAEYKKKQDDLIVSTFEAVTAFDNFSSQLAALGQSKWFDDIAAKFGLIKASMLDGIDAIEEYDEAMSKLAGELYDDFKTEQENKPKPYKPTGYGVPQRAVRNTSFDYNKSQADIIGEEIDIVNNHMAKLNEQIERAKSELSEGGWVADAVLKSLQKELKACQEEAATLNEKMVIAQLQEDVDKYSKDLFNGYANGIKSTATAMDRLIKSVESVNEAMSDPDTSAWEKFMSIMNALVQVFDTVTSMIELFNSLSTISNTLAEAKESLNARQLAQKQEEIGLVSGLAGAEAAEGATAMEAAAGKAAANKVNLALLTQMAFAAGAANSQELPWPYNLAALAANQAAITEMIVAGKALAAFKDGGVVNYGTSSGDNTLARVNRGEMILSGSEQATLFNALKSGNFGAFGSNSQITFKVHGSDLVATLNNYRSKVKG